jgi:hypothetical protein
VTRGAGFFAQPASASAEARTTGVNRMTNDSAGRPAPALRAGADG